VLFLSKSCLNVSENNIKIHSCILILKCNTYFVVNKEKQFCYLLFTWLYFFPSASLLVTFFSCFLLHMLFCCLFLFLFTPDAFLVLLFLVPCTCCHHQFSFPSAPQEILFQLAALVLERGSCFLTSFYIAVT